MADYTNFHEATGWKPQITVEEGVDLVCEPYLDDESV
jgi:UDP-glucose 4-epimerase